MRRKYSSISRRSIIRAVVAGALAPGLVIARARSGISAEQTGDIMKIRIAFADHDFTATLHDNPSSRDLASLLPLDLTIDDYAHNEKIAYLPRKLTVEGSGPFDNEQPGDLCYFAPWGNLAFFYGDYRWSRGLIRLGRLDDGVQPLLTRGEFPLRIEHLS